MTRPAMLASDLAQAVRGLRNQRGLAPSVVLTLGIAIAATSVIAVLANQALREPLPYRDASRLLLLWEKSRGGDYRLASYPTFLDWQAAAPRSLAGLAFVRGNLDVLSTADGPLRATTGFVSPGYFKTLGATPQLGRFFTSGEEAAGHGDAAVLSERLWLRQSLVLAGGGADAGVGGGIAIARVLRATLDSVLYRTSPFAVLPLVIAAGVLGTITFAAAWMPARRAASVDPVIALRSE